MEQTIIKQRATTLPAGERRGLPDDLPRVPFTMAVDLDGGGESSHDPPVE